MSITSAVLESPPLLLALLPLLPQAVMLRSVTTDIAKAINAGTLTLASKTLAEQTAAADAKVTSYKADLEAGYWVVLVRGTVKVYNPMLVGVYYNPEGSGDDNAIVTNVAEVNANNNWTLTTTNAYAKSTEPTIEKTASVQTQNVGGTVDFIIETQIPSYSAEYTAATFEVKDTLTNLTLNADTLTVLAGGVDVTDEATVCTITGDAAGSTTFTVAFDSDWLLDTANNDGKNISKDGKGLYWFSSRNFL